MQFRTAIEIKRDALPPLCHDDSVLLLGSCFSDNIGLKLQGAMVDAVTNPFGTTYNPISLLKCIELLTAHAHIATDELFLHNGVWNHFMFHSRFSGADAETTAQAMNASIERGHTQLARCSHLFLTLGTAFVYRLADGTVANNCHKLPSNRFTRSLCDIAQLTDVLDSIANLTHSVNPQAHIVFTVSPIRHLADGLEMNHLSKSLLTVAAHSTVAKHPGYCHYFPAYEMLNDDLRDYRFYAADMTHPSDTAIEYVWEQFKSAFFDNRERQIAEQCERLSKMLAHRPTSPNADIVRQFKQKCHNALADMAKRYPHIAKLDYLKHYITFKEL